MTKIEFVVQDETEYRRVVLNMLIHHISSRDSDVEETDQLYRYLLKERRRLIEGATIGE